jgi:glycosyltransferase involved in cell wall biosynthesis
MVLTAVIWIDWYSYHISRFRALCEHPRLRGRVAGIELVGGCGVHHGLQFRDAERAGLPISTLFPAGDWYRTGQIKLARAVWDRLNRLRPSSVLVPGWATVPAVAAALWAKLHAKHSILMSETTEADYGRVWWKEWPKRLLIRLLFDCAIAGGKPHIRYLMRLGVPARRIGGYYDVVDNDFYDAETARARQLPESRLTYGLPEQYFLYVGRLAPEKNVGVLLRAFARYRSMGGTWPLVLVGDGPERGALELQCHDSGLGSQVTFAGLRTTRETIFFYSFAGCFVLPSSREPWGLVVNEAMASGLPVIVSNRCGCAEDLVQPGRNGYLFDPSSEAELADRMLMVSDSSESTLRAMGRMSQEIIARYSPAHWASEVARVARA